MDHRKGHRDLLGRRRVQKVHWKPPWKPPRKPPGNPWKPFLKGPKWSETLRKRFQKQKQP